MKFLYIVGLTDLQISKTLDQPIKVANDTFITNNADFVKSLIPPQHIGVLGLLEYNFLTSGRPVIFKTGSVLVEEGAHIEVINLLRGAHGFLLSLWMNRDSSANCDTGFAIGLDSDAMHSNTLKFHYSLANGEKSVTALGQNDLERVCDISDKHFRGLKEQDNPSRTVLQKTTGRINISTYHLQMARSASDLAIKIATYCSFFESLFSTNTTELSHQLSERIAFSLTDDPHERLEIFIKTKKAYGVRSKTVHGDIIQPREILGLIETAGHCDVIARKIYTKVITCPETCKLFESTNEKIDDHMRNLIFGITRAF
ncbi:MAG: hypothetical protein ACRESJ_15265 [Pseudomonas sp.]|uniref:hypothetical protein n=1 Tax=Pseudomonas sp. TaxID=306 RepID=UPI003D6E89B6